VGDEKNKRTRLQDGLDRMWYGCTVHLQTHTVRRIKTKRRTPYSIYGPILNIRRLFTALIAFLIKNLEAFRCEHALPLSICSVDARSKDCIVAFGLMYQLVHSDGLYVQYHWHHVFYATKRPRFKHATLCWRLNKCKSSTKPLALVLLL